MTKLNVFDLINQKVKAEVALLAFDQEYAARRDVLLVELKQLDDQLKEFLSTLEAPKRSAKGSAARTIQKLTKEPVKRRKKPQVSIKQTIRDIINEKPGVIHTAASVQKALSKKGINRPVTVVGSSLHRMVNEDEFHRPEPGKFMSTQLAETTPSE